MGGKICQVPLIAVVGGWKRDCFFQTMFKNRLCVFGGPCTLQNLLRWRRWLALVLLIGTWLEDSPTQIEWLGFSTWRQWTASQGCSCSGTYMKNSHMQPLLLQWSRGLFLPVCLSFWFSTIESWTGAGLGRFWVLSQGFLRDKRRLSPRWVWSNGNFWPELHLPPKRLTYTVGP